MLYEFRGLPFMPGEFENSVDGELSRIRAAAHVEECDEEEERHCGFCGRKLIPGTEDYEEHYHRHCSI